MEVRLAVRDSPDCARFLLTVRLAISSARFVLAPRSLALSFTCWYCRSRLLLHDCGMWHPFHCADLGVPRRELVMRLGFGAGAVPNGVRMVGHGAGIRWSW